MNFLNICREDQICLCTSENNGEKRGAQTLSLFQRHMVWTRSEAPGCHWGWALAGKYSLLAPGQVSVCWGQLGPLCQQLTLLFVLTTNSKKWEKNLPVVYLRESLFHSVEKTSGGALPSTAVPGELFWDSDIPHLWDRTKETMWPSFLVLISSNKRKNEYYLSAKCKTEAVLGLRFAQCISQKINTSCSNKNPRSLRGLTQFCHILV